MDWLQSSLGLFTSYTEAESLAASALSSRLEEEEDPCYLVPAFSGLLCPHWREDARGLIAGFDAGCSRGDLVAAAYRASAYQTQEVLEAAAKACGASSTPCRSISVDGGLAQSGVLLQSLADITAASVIRPCNSEVMTALGAAVSTALAAQIEPSGLLKARGQACEVQPKASPEMRAKCVHGWRKAVERSLGWQK